MIHDERAFADHARRAYEHARLRTAAWSTLPLVAIVAVAWFVDRKPFPFVVAAPALLVVAFVFAWRGRDLARGVIPGVAAGALPFVAMHVAALVGHTCHGPLCFSTCLPAAFVSGAIAGVFLARRARRSRSRVQSWSAAAIVAVLTASLGCACVGLGGVVGLVAGIVLASVPVLALAPAGDRA